MKRFPFVKFLVLAGIFWPLLGHASEVCDTPFARKVSDNMGRAKRAVGQQVDTSISISNSPFVYTNPDAGCDLGFSMPGLPSFGGSIGELDSCQVLQNITGSLVREINQGMQNAVDNALDATVGDKTQFDIDLTDMVTREIEGASK